MEQNNTFSKIYITLTFIENYYILLFKPITSFLFIFTTVLYVVICRYYTIEYYQQPYFKLLQNNCLASQKSAQTMQSNNIVPIPSLYKLLT